MAERTAASAQGTPSPAELLRAAMEKIVFFEWRLSELASELAKAQSRAASAEAMRAAAEENASASQQQARAARAQAAELDAERSRLASLLSRPAHAPLQLDARALEAERDRGARLQAQLDEAREEIARARSERERWLNEMLAQARAGDDAPAALAQFISELRGEVITLRDRQKQCDALLERHGIAPPPPAEVPLSPPPHREDAPVEEARKLWAEGRIGGGAHDARLAELAASVPRELGSAARALAEQCVRTLASSDAGRREQAARHLAAVPLPAAAPLLATALGNEHEPRARAQLCRALVACGGEGAAEIVAQLQHEPEPPLVRLAALEALATLPAAARAAVERAAGDPSAALRRRAAALAAAEGFEDLLHRLLSDPEASVRHAAESARREPAPEPPPAQLKAVPRPEDEALLAIQSALFGLTEAELAERLSLPEPETARLAQQLVAQGRLGRRGKRLVLAEER